MAPDPLFNFHKFFCFGETNLYKVDRGVDIGRCVGVTPPIIENLNFVGQEPNNSLSNVGQNKAGIKWQLLNFPLCQKAFA